MTAELSPARLSELFAELGAELDQADDGEAVLHSLVRLAIRRVDGADYAGVTIGRQGQIFTTVAASDELVNQADQIQYDLESGPCVDAVVADTCFNAADLRSDDRWPEFGRRCAETTGIISMLSIRLFTEPDANLIAGLNMYSRQADAFDQTSEAMANLLATHGALAAAKAAAQTKSRNLLIALKSSREIGIAMGIIMAYEKVTQDQAFDLLRIVSQHTHRKVAEIAAEVAETGALPVLPRPRSNR